MKSENKNLTQSGKIKRPSYSQVCMWVKTSWDKVDNNCVINGFRKALKQEENTGTTEYGEVQNEAIGALQFNNDDGF